MHSLPGDTELLNLKSMEQLILRVSQIVISFCCSLISTSYQSVTLGHFKSVVVMKKEMAELTDTQIKTLLRSHLKRILAEDERERSRQEKMDR